MKDKVYEILEVQLGKKVESVSEIVGLGSVNKVYYTKCKDGDFIVRINPDLGKKFEFFKEKWCIEKAKTLNIPSPKVVKVGIIHDLPYMVLDKIEGLNGSKCSREEKIIIWESLGRYARKLHAIKEIDKLEIETDEFHSNWSSKLDYNISQLSPNDSLIKRQVLSKKEHENSIVILKKLKKLNFNHGLIHGDLCPRNVIFKNNNIYLLDWGSSKIDIVPHSELGIVQTDNKLSDLEYTAFLSGLGLNKHYYEKIKMEISEINFLNNLDLYRWAQGSNFLEIDNYSQKLRLAYDKMI